MIGGDSRWQVSTSIVFKKASRKLTKALFFSFFLLPFFEQQKQMIGPASTSLRFPVGPTWLLFIDHSSLFCRVKEICNTFHSSIGSFIIWLLVIDDLYLLPEFVENLL